MRYIGLMASVMSLATCLLTPLASSEDKPAGQIKEIHGTAYWKGGPSSEPVRLDRRRDRGRALHGGESVRCKSRCVLMLFGNEVRVTNKMGWYPIPMPPPKEPTIQDVSSPGARTAANPHVPRKGHAEVVGAAAGTADGGTSEPASSGGRTVSHGKSGVRKWRGGAIGAAAGTADGGTEEVSGTITLVNAAAHLIVVTTPSGVPYDFNVNSATKIKISDAKGKLGDLAGATNEHVTVTYVAAEGGNIAKTIEVSQ